MAKNFPINPKHPERICWGCDRYCPAKSLACGNGSDRTMHPAELFGEDWHLPGDWGIEKLITTDKPTYDAADTSLISEKTPSGST